jgi:DNA-binding MarR family transcriptional regulator
MASKKELDSRIDKLNTRLKVQQEDIMTDTFIKFSHTAEKMTNFLNSELRKYGLNHTQMRIIVALVLSGGTMTPTELSYDIMRSKYATTKAIDSLEQLNYLKSAKSDLRSKTKVDRRLRKVRITEKGVEILENTMGLRHDIGLRVMCCLDQKELNQLKAILLRLEKHAFSL